MGNKVGSLIKEARTAKKISQTKLAEQIGISASDLGKAEKGEKELSQAVLKKIAKETGITQKSLLDAAKEEAEPASDVGKIFSAVADALAEKKTAKKAEPAKKTAAKKAEPAKKTAAKKEEPAKKTAAKKEEPAKKTAAKKAEPAKKAAAKKAEPAKKAAAKKTAAAAKTELTAAEKKLIELYRAADSDTKKSAVALLKGESAGTGLVGELLGGLLKK